MRAVLDAGPIIHLSWIDRLTLLDRLFERVMLPSAVREEVLSAVAGTLGLDAIRLALLHSRLEVVVPRTAGTMMLSVRPIGAGEAEAIRLSQQVRADLFISDDLQARTVARQCNLTVTGTVGVLKHAREQGLIEPAVPLLLQLRELGLWISDALVDGVRQEEAAQ